MGCFNFIVRGHSESTERHRRDHFNAEEVKAVEAQGKGDFQGIVTLPVDLTEDTCEQWIDSCVRIRNVSDGVRQREGSCWKKTRNISIAFTAVCLLGLAGGVVLGAMVSPWIGIAITAVAIVSAMFFALRSGQAWDQVRQWNTNSIAKYQEQRRRLDGDPIDAYRYLFREDLKGKIATLSEARKIWCQANEKYAEKAQRMNGLSASSADDPSRAAFIKDFFHHNPFDRKEFDYVYGPEVGDIEDLRLVSKKYLLLKEEFLSVRDHAAGMRQKITDRRGVELRKIEATRNTLLAPWQVARDAALERTRSGYFLAIQPHQESLHRQEALIRRECCPERRSIELRREQKAFDSNPTVIEINRRFACEKRRIWAMYNMAAAPANRHCDEACSKIRGKANEQMQDVEGQERANLSRFLPGITALTNGQVARVAVASHDESSGLYPDLSADLEEYSLPAYQPVWNEDFSEREWNDYVAAVRNY